MKCDPAVLDMAVKYLKVYFLGMPIIMLYNFSTAVLRGVGDTFRPLIYLVIGGIANVFLNVFFVLVLKKDVEGVAIATVVSNGISAVFAILALFKETGAAQLKKDGYKAAMEEEKRKKKYALVRAGIIRSCVYEKLCAALTAEYEEKTAAVRQGLLFYLQYAAKPETSGGTSAEYADYSLSATERVQAVKNYYHAKYTNASERFDAFKKDTTAPTYLGEYYSATYDYFAQGN